MLSPVTQADEWRYTVRPGDTLIGFSQRHLLNPADWVKLHRHNALANPHYLVPGQTLRIPLSLLKQKPAPAELVAVSGQVRAAMPGEEFRQARIGELLATGAELHTAENSSAKLRFADGSTLVLQPSSRLQLDTLSVYEGGGMVDTRMRLQQGRSEIHTNPRRDTGTRMQVITPSAVAAVRGTRFRVAAEPQATREETLEGEVALAATGRQVGVAAGYGSVAAAGQPPAEPVALLETPDLRHLPARIDRLPMVFDLVEQANAVHWTGQIARDAGFNEILLEQFSHKPRLVFGDLPDGSYVLRVAASDANGLLGLDAVHAFELHARPFPPLLLYPAQDAVIRTARPEIRWSEALGVSRYHVELALDSEFREKVLDQVLTERAWPLAQALNPGAYFLRAASIANGRQGPYSDVVRFIYKPAPSAPDLGQPTMTFGANTLEINLPAPPQGLHYEAELAADQDRKQILWHGESADGRLDMPRPDSGRRYLSVRLVEADGTFGPYSTQGIDVPRQTHPEILLFLLPLLAL